MSQAQHRCKKQRSLPFERELRVAAARGSVLLSFTRELRVSQLRVLCNSCSYAAFASLRVVSTRVEAKLLRSLPRSKVAMCFFVELHALQSQGLLFAFVTRVRLCSKAESCNLRWLTVCQPPQAGVRNTSRGKCKKCKEVQRGVSVGRYIA